MSRSKDKGTWWESAIVRYLIECGVTGAERRALRGQFDRGDIAGVIGVVIEAKHCKKIELAAFLSEALTERDNDKASIGFVWIKKRGRTSPARGYVLMEGETVVTLLREAGYIPAVPA